MNLLLGLREGLREMWAHRFRSFLSMLGIILGVASLMTTFAITSGMAIKFRKNLILFGGVEKMSVVDAPVPEEQQDVKDMSGGRTYKDVIALRKAPLVKHVSPEQQMSGTFIRGNKRYNAYRVLGVEEGFLEVQNYEIGSGRFFSVVDQDKRNRVLVIGSEVHRRLWGKSRENPLHQEVKFNGVTFKIVGLFKDYENRWKNSSVIMPLTTMQELFFSSNIQNGVDLGPKKKIDRLNVQITDADHIDAAIEQMRNILERTHRGIKDFGFHTREDWSDMVENAVGGVRISGFLIAVVTLIAGGVGITNIMLASLKERTREIGIRRAIGAGGMDVFNQVAMEAVLISVFGGVLGVLTGFGLIELVEWINSENKRQMLMVVETSGVILSFGAAVIVGLLAGVFPALRASQLRPIDALKFE